MNDLEQSVRQTLSARVRHLTDERLDPDVPIARSSRRRPRVIALPLAAAAAVVAAVVLGGALAANTHKPAHRAATPPATPTTEPTTEPTLVDNSWLLESITQHGRTTPTPGGFSGALEFQGKVVAGEVQCTHFWAGVVVNGSTITIGQQHPSGTRCTNTGRALEHQVLTALHSINRWTISRGKLQLAGADGTVLVFHLNPSISVLLQGHRGRGTYRLLLEGDNSNPSLLWQWRPNGGAWGTPQYGGIASPDPQLVLTCSGVDSGAGFVYGWAPTAATRVVYGTSHPVELKLYPAATTGQQVGFGGFVDPARAHTLVTVYGKGDHVLARGQIPGAENGYGYTC
jgi:heat shock protein HslJ